ncbi:MAG TPA: ABC transporter substrate-binding protein [Candidatus Binatia bacterium]|jgi:NitT/TauT family transport system substrate-binding protein
MKRFIITIVMSMIAMLSSGTGAWAQKSLTAVRLGIAGISGTNSHPYVDKQLGLYQKHNIDLELIAFQGGTQLIQAMLAGDLPLAFSEGVTVLASNIKGVNLLFIGGIVNTFPFTILTKAEIKTPAELRGKKIAISRFGSSSDVAVRHAVERYDLKPEKDVVILQVGGQSERFAALRAGVVDAAIVSPPFNLVGRRLGFNDLIDMSESGVAYSHQQIVARKDFLERQPELVLRFLRGTIEGLAYWKDPSKKDVVTQNIAKFLKLDAQKDKDQLDETFRYYGKVFPTKPYPTLEGLELSASMLKKARPDAKDLQPKDSLTNRFIAELEKEGFLAKVFGGR